MKLPLLPLLATGALLLSVPANAAVLVSYTFTGNNSSIDPSPVPSNFGPTTTGVNVTSSFITEGTDSAIGLRIDSSGGPAGVPFLQALPGNSAENSNTNTGTAITSAAAAISAGSYFTFTLSAQPGYTLNLESLTFQVTRGGTSHPRGFALQNSAFGFSTDGSTNLGLSSPGPSDTVITSPGTVEAGDFTTLTSTRATYTNVTVDLSDAAYQNLSSIEFRFFSFSPTTGSSVEYDNIIVNGVSVIPEPCAAALLAMAGLTVVMGRRRPLTR